MRKMNNKGFMIVEVLVVTVVVMIIFLVIYSNFYPLVGEYERRLEYSDVESKYALFNIKKIYANRSNGNRYKVRSDFGVEDTVYIDLLETVNDELVCKSDYILANDQTYCNTLVNSLGIERIIVSEYNTLSLKGQNIEAKLNKYIDYLPEYSSFINDNTMYRMIIKTENGYANAKFDIDLLGLDITYLEENELETTFFPGEKKLFTFTGCSNINEEFYYQINDLSNDNFTITNFFNNGKSTTSITFEECQTETLVIEYTGATASETTNIKDLYSMAFSTTVGNFPVDSGYAAITSNTNLIYNMINNYQKFIVPKTGYYNIELNGASGGGTDVEGANTTGKIFLEAGTILYVYIGGTGSNSSGENGGYNGGGSATNYHDGCGGGGATDIRYFGDDTPSSASLEWNSNLGLNSRIMVAAGGGGEGYYYSGDIGGGLINVRSDYMAEDVTQTFSSGGGFFGIGANNTEQALGGGGGGYYGGGAGTVSSSYYYSGGSSFISGYAGVNAITAATITNNPRTHTNNTLHYSLKYFIAGSMATGTNSGNGSAEITYLGTVEPTRSTNLNSVRYIKNCTNGNSLDSYNRWVEIQAIKDGENKAYHKLATGITNDATYPISNITDGDITSANYARGATGNQCVVVDLGSTYNLDEIAIWHYWADSRTYYNNVTSVSSNGSTYTTVMNNTHAETSEGNRINAYKARTQYTLTASLNGGTCTYPGGTCPTSYSVISGDKITLVPPTRTNYVFKGWSISGTGSSISNNTVTMGTANTTVTAQWRALSSITITSQPTTTTYAEGATFSNTGMVVRANYSDGTTATVTSSTTASPSTLSFSNTSVTVSYTYGGVTKTAIVPITVTRTVVVATSSARTIYENSSTTSYTALTLGCGSASTQEYAIVAKHDFSSYQGYTVVDATYSFTATKGGSTTNNPNIYAVRAADTSVTAVTWATKPIGLRYTSNEMTTMTATGSYDVSATLAVQQLVDFGDTGNYGVILAVSNSNTTYTTYTITDLSLSMTYSNASRSTTYTRIPSSAQTANTYVTVSSTYNSTYAGYKAFDFNNTNGWATANNAIDPYVQYDMTTAYKNIIVDISNRINSSYVNGPNDYYFWVSNDGTTWYNPDGTTASTTGLAIDDEYGSYSPGLYSYWGGRSVSLNNSTAYRYVRIYFTDWYRRTESSNNYLAVGEIRFWGST
ncbi:MAG TPA: glycine-rich protein [Bacilli bacterium]|nr:glycine-rich protein [Bacilli bacterium]